MHCGAEVTESSTNKQHHLSLSSLYPRLSSDGLLQTVHDIWENWTVGASHAGDSFSLGL